jgi:hypothetical protein
VIREETMEIEDFSKLRAASPSALVIPLNGKRYKCDPEPPADVVLAATTGVDSRALEAMAKMADGGELTAGEQAAAAGAGSSSMTKAARFLEQVLEPESLEQWRRFVRPPEGLEGKALTEWKKHKITWQQVVAVFRALVQHYSGGRPTTPPSSSGNGHDDGGATSTAGVQPAEA